MKKSTVIIVWGLITGIASSVFYLFLNMSDNMNSGLSYISWIIIFAGLLVGALQYRKANNGHLTFGEGYTAGILMTLIIAVIGTISFFIYLNGHPDFSQKMMDMQRTKMVNKGMSEDQIEMAMKMASKFMSSTSMIIFGFFGSIVTGAILSLLSSGITMKKPPIDGENTTNA